MKRVLLLRLANDQLYFNDSMPDGDVRLHRRCVRVAELVESAILDETHLDMLEGDDYKTHDLRVTFELVPRAMGFRP